jgi:Fur family zinc uptake transcriptional regulator
VARQTAISSHDRSVLSALTSAARPLSAYDILDRVRESGVKAPTQVYRSLEKLARHGLVHRIEALNAFVACDHAHEHHRASPAFVICRDCGKVREVEDERLQAIAHSLGDNGFAVDAVSLEIYGRCGHCLKPERAAQ